MKAFLTTRYGPPEVLRLAEVEKPTPKPHEVRVKVCATTVASGDCRARSFHVPLHVWLLARLVVGITKPRSPIQGLWLAGEVEAVGQKVTRLQVGSPVVARTPDGKFGAYAEYACLPENGIMAPIPAQLSYEEAVSIPFGGLTALYFLKKGALQREQKVLVYGASGAVGTAAVQLAKYFGAEVTGVCSTANLALVKSLGAGRVIDYTQEDFTRRGERYDLIFDAVGKISRFQCKPALAPKGRFLSVITSGHMRMGSGEMVFLNGLVEAGKFKPVIDRIYPFEQMAEAHRYVELGHKKGNVVITLRPAL